MKKLTPQQMVSTAIAIAGVAFEHKFDKGGNPYIEHCLSVMNRMPKSDPEIRAAAVLHDLIEDTDWSFDDLRKEGFSERVIETVRMLTHDHTVSYDDYIRKIRTNDDARRIKLADLEDNSNITRLKGLRAKDFARLEKYCKAYVYLSD